MTAKEAISQLKDLMHDRESFFNNDGDDDVFRADARACEIAIEALEKQIPKKPIFVDTRFKHLGKHVSDGTVLRKCYKCPNCSSHIFHEFDSEECCVHCGQALDWSEDSHEN